MKTNVPKSGGNPANFFLFLFILLLIPTANAVTDAAVYYSFEDMPSTVTDDLASEDRDGNLTSSIISTTFSKVGNWALYLDTTEYLIGSTNASNHFNTNNEMVGARTYSFWLYPTNSGDRSELFTDLANKTTGLNGIIWVNLDTTNEQLITRIYDHNSAANRRYTTSTGALSANSWNHVVIVLNQTYSSLGVQSYINNAWESWTLTASSGAINNISVASLNNQWLIIGETNQSDPAGTQQPFFIDEFAVYNRSLTPTEISQLYNSGYGLNPYNTTRPSQIASISAVSIGTQSSFDADYGSAFIGETNLSISFTYNAASYEAYVGASVNTGDFAAEFIDADTVRWYSFSAQVPQTAIQINASNSAGSRLVNTSFTVSGFGIPTQTASISDWEITTGNTESRVFADYFGGYSTRFLQYTDPDDGVTQINVSSGFGHNNSCFQAQIIGDTLQVTGVDTAGCSVSAVMIAGNGVTSATSNAFTIIINPAATVQGGAVLQYLDLWLDWIPNSEDMSTQYKLLFSLAIMGGILIAGFVFINQGADPRWVSVGIGLSEAVAFLALTSLGIIPLWIFVVIAFIVALGGVSMLARIFGRTGY